MAFKIETCSCGKGLRSAYDGMCGHCRSNRQKALHERLYKAKAALVEGFKDET